jgi:sugar (pentulose or hexulose) kinase
MSKQNAQYIENGSAVLGFELGSTRIKATLTGADSKPLASGSYGWENKLVDGVWTYDLEDV